MPGSLTMSAWPMDPNYPGVTALINELTMAGWDMRTTCGHITLMEYT